MFILHKSLSVPSLVSSSLITKSWLTLSRVKPPRAPSPPVLLPHNSQTFKLHNFFLQILSGPSLAGTAAPTGREG